MAKRKPAGGKASAKKSRKSAKAARSARRPTKARRAAKPKSRAGSRKAATKARPARRAASKKARTPSEAQARSTPARLGRERRILEDVVPTPPSSLDLNRRGSAARTGRAEMAQSHANHRSMTPDISAGDLDVNVEDAYFVGDESPGGDNPTPDQDVVEEIGKALGVEYQDAEELRGSEKLEDRDKHRWELDPASSEDYKSRK